MLPTNAQGLVVVLLAIVPGFVATFAWARSRTWKGSTSDLRTVLLSIAVSVSIHLVASPLTIAWLYPIRHHLEDHPGRVGLWAFVTVLALPLVLGVAAGKGSDTLGRSLGGRWRARIAKIWPEPVPPSIWDWLFIDQPPYGSFVVVSFKDGSQLAGVFAKGSMALTSPEPHGLYLVSEWLIDENGDVVEEVPDSKGVMLIDVDNVRSVRILKGGHDEPSDN